MKLKAAMLRLAFTVSRFETGTLHVTPSSYFFDTDARFNESSCSS
jgi:hypothetical protein